MKIKLVAYGIAKEIIGGKQQELEIPEGSTIHQLKEILISKYPSFATLRSLSFAVGEEYRYDSFQLRSGSEVVLIPPVAGG
ncbi:MAG: MoaD/ThiS family protein [Cyclobacteriaceae bacterium]|jgi:molybdopterin converting factor small subunit|nr:MoaD/ThiS family protein [Cyclobacteriaceae bacterium]